jgi:NitT/TauT family transport system substrate-binding protein
MIPGSGSLGTIQLVATGKVTFGDVDAGTFATAIESGISNVTAVMVLEYGNVNCLISLKPIPTPASLQGLRFGYITGGAQDYLVPVMMASVGANFSKVIQVPVTASANDASLLAGKFDFTSCSVDNDLVSLELSGVLNGQHVYTLNDSNWGIPTYSYILITSNQFMNSNPAAVAAFVKGTIEGVQYAMSNPAQAINDEVQNVPSLNATIGALQWKTAEGFFATTYSVHNYGMFNSTQFIAGEQTFLNAKNVTITVPITGAFTNQFVPPGQTLPIPPGNK